ncbi:hypothetical protein ACK389_13905 [Streptomyces antibioticus]|nr:hypothetical protein [Streptomyces antibioticus]MCX5171993.1 hypothetical protein [Streptomyces antibioticus]
MRPSLPSVRLLSASPADQSRSAPWETARAAHSPPPRPAHPHPADRRRAA